MKNLLQRYGLLLGAVAAAIVFHLFWEKQINNILVNNVLMLVQSSPTNDVIFIGVILLATGVLVSRVVRRYVPSDRQSVVALVLLCFYVYYRLDGTVWTFQHFTFAEKVKYTDALAGVLGLQVILWILSYNYQSFLGVKIISLFKNIKTFLNKSLHVIYVYYRFIRRKINKKIRRNHIPTLPNQLPNVAPILDDLPLEDGGDKLGYGTYAQQIAQKIQVTTASKRAIAIGVHGQWGSGKTSFMSLLRTELKKENYILLDFAAWNSQTPQAIVQDFFQTLQAEMSQYHDQTASLLTNYANQLVKLKDNPTTQIIQSVSAAFTGFESTQQLHERISDSIARIGRKIVIFIDDLDRLDKAEIVEVLRLIRNTANFQNTFFVVAYDRDYIVNALEKSDFHGATQYLEKIFQLEINLPAYEKKILIEELNKQLKECMNKTDMIDYATIDTGDENKKIILQFITNMRDVTRLSNLISLDFKNLYGGVYFEDFLKLEILKMKHPDIFHALWNKKDIFFEGVETKYYKRSIDASNKYLKISKNFDEWIRDNFKNNHAKAEAIKDLLSSIFTMNDEKKLRDRYSVSVIYPLKFYRYFTYKTKGTIKQEDLYKVLSQTEEEIHHFITQTIDNYLEIELMDLIYSIDNEKLKNDYTFFKNTIKAIFYFANHTSYIWRFPEYRAQDLYEKVKYVIEVHGEQEVHDILIECFYKNKESNQIYDFVFTFLKYINSFGIEHSGDKIFIFSQEEYYDIFYQEIVSYLKLNGNCFDEYLVQKITYSSIYYKWNTPEDENSEDYQESKKIKDIILEVIKKDYKNIITYALVKNGDMYSIDYDKLRDFYYCGFGIEDELIELLKRNYKLSYENNDANQPVDILKVVNDVLKYYNIFSLCKIGEWDNQPVKKYIYSNK